MTHRGETEIVLEQMDNADDDYVSIPTPPAETAASPSSPPATAAERGGRKSTAGDEELAMTSVQPRPLTVMQQLLLYVTSVCLSVPLTSSVDSLKTANVDIVTC